MYVNTKYEKGEDIIHTLSNIPYASGIDIEGKQ
jgi:hypothetical protein